MRKLSKVEWIAAGLAVIFVAYTLFGGDIMNLFNQSQMTDDQSASALNSLTTNNQGVIINDLVVGTGEGAVSGNGLKVHYILSLEDGTVLQNSKDFGQPFEFVLGSGQVIPGWEIGLQGMKAGGTRTIIIPPELGYGAQQAGPIPANSTLIFTVELSEIVNITPELVQ